MNGFGANVGIMLFTGLGLIRDIHSLAHNLPFYFEGSQDVDGCVTRLFALPQVLSAVPLGFGDLLLEHQCSGCTQSWNKCVQPHRPVRNQICLSDPHSHPLEFWFRSEMGL